MHRITKQLVLLAAIAMLFAPIAIFAAGAAEEDEIEISEEFIGNRNADVIATVAINREETLRTPYDSRRAYVEEATRRWAENHPNYGIELQILTPGEISQDMSRLLAETEAGVGPDFIHLDSFWVGNFLDAGLLQPLDEYLSEADRNAFFDFTQDVTVRDGQQYAVWGETDARLLHYRKDLIDTPPETWDELIEIAVEVSEEHDIHGFTTNAGQGEGASNENTWAYFWAQGGEIFDESEDWRPVLGEGENRQMMINIYSFMKELVDSGASPEAIVGWTGFDPIMAEIRADNVAMTIQGTWAVPQIQDIVENAEDKWDFAPYPQLERDMRANSNGGWTWAVLSEDSEIQELAMSYIMETVGSREAMAQRTQAYGYIPTRTDVFEEDPFYSEDPIQQRFAEELEYGRARPATSLYPAISDLNARAMGQVLTGDATPTEAVDELQRRALAEWEDWSEDR